MIIEKLLYLPRLRFIIDPNLPHPQSVQSKCSMLYSDMASKAKPPKKLCRKIEKV